MQVEIVRVPSLPQQPGSTYDTQYVYTGFGRVDISRKKLMVWKRNKDGTERIVEMDAPDVLPQSYHTEHVRVTVYSDNPRVWKEEHANNVVYFFKQLVQT